MTESCHFRISDICGQESLCKANSRNLSISHLLLTLPLLPWGTLGPSSSCWGPWGLSLTSAVSNHHYPVPLSSWVLRREGHLVQAPHYIAGETEALVWGEVQLICPDRLPQ